jgi:hypothetical protein
VFNRARITLLRWDGSLSPEQGRLLTAEEPSQLAEHLDQAVGVVVAGRDVEGKLGTAAADAVADRGPWGADMRSCSSAVLMEETAEPIAAANLTSLAIADDVRTGGWIRRLQPKPRCGR